MSDKPDWDAIRREYESSRITFKALAAKYNVATTTLYDHSRKWSRSPEFGIPNKDTPNSEPSVRVLRSELPTPPSALKGANLIIEDLVSILEEQREKKAKLDIADYLKITNALFQCNRIIVNALPEKDEEEDTVLTIDTRDLSTADLANLKTLALNMKKENEAG